MCLSLKKLFSKLFKKKKEEKNVIKFYSDWIKKFNEIKENNIDTYYDLLIEGELKDYKYSINLFLDELCKFINFELNKYIDIYGKKISLAFETNEFASLETLINMLYMKFNKLFFFRKLDFIPKVQKDELTLSIKNALSEYLRKVKNSISDTSNIVGFELDYLISKKLNDIEVQYV